jgi:hypothetical protein
MYPGKQKGHPAWDGQNKWGYFNRRGSYTDGYKNATKMRF